MRRSIVLFSLVGLVLRVCIAAPIVANACAPPTTAAVAAAFDLAGNGLLPASYPRYYASGPVKSIPPVLLKAIGWVESGWRQFDQSGRPLVAPDFGYGVMQVTSGMAGAFGDVRGAVPPDVQSKIATKYAYNIAYAAGILASKWAATPRIGNGDPSVLENWYYALWAYNGWGWVNNPNNPRFDRVGTPAQNPGTFPYQERVLYFVAHPPHDSVGNPLWAPTQIALPAASIMGSTPHSFTPSIMHRQPVPALSAVYGSPSRVIGTTGSSISTVVQVENTGTLPWPSTGSLAVTLGYHLLSSAGDPFATLSPFSKGVVAFAGGTLPLARDVSPGQSVSLPFVIRAPAIAGKYKVVWDLTQGAGTWFSFQGVLPRLTVLRVSEPPLPTPVATLTATALPRVENVEYVADTSFPDGSIVAGRQTFDKGWLLFNSGQTPWGPGWTARRVSGTKLGPTSVPLPATSTCHTLDLIVTMTAPAKPNSYSETWRIFDKSGEAVGDQFTVVVDVRGTTTGATPTPVPTPSPTAVSTPRPSPTATAVG